MWWQLVVIQNSYAAATVRVEAGQKVVSTGLYGLVRHPMYTGNVIMMVGIPLALGSYWGLVFVVPGLIVLAWRIRDEEKLLRKELDGYREYTQKVRYRLVPGYLVTARTTLTDRWPGSRRALLVPAARSSFLPTARRTGWAPQGGCQGLC